jgi:hypothetical protein
MLTELGKEHFMIENDLNLINRKLDHLHDMIHAIMGAITTMTGINDADRAKLQAMTARVKADTDAMRTAINQDAHKSTAPQST